jgi:cytochrome d ubiquinol oxidase subunit II
MGIDLSIIWFVIIVFATLMYIVMDGFDLGIGILFPTPNADDRDVMVNSVAPVWDGNETWLVLGGAALFGAFPLAYAVIVDALTIPLTLMLIGLIFRGVAFEFRFKATPAHRPFWDKAFIGGSILATFTQGVTVGAVINGFTVTGRAYTGGPLTGLPRLTCSAAGLVVAYALLGSTWLVMKSENALQQRMRRYPKRY